MQDAEAHLDPEQSSVIAQANVVKNLVSLSNELDSTSVALAVDLLGNIAESSLGAKTEIGDEVNVNIATAVSSLLDVRGAVQNLTFMAQLGAIVENVVTMEVRAP